MMAWTIFCLSIQLGTNLHNDYADFCLGADTDKRVGHTRATASGWWTPTQTCVYATGMLMLTFLAGLYLSLATAQFYNKVLWFWLLSSIFNAFAYTGGPYPLGYLGLGEWSIAYAGLGEVFVLVYFGLLATLMIPYLLSVSAITGMDGIWKTQIVYGIQVGLLATNIIVVNNLRDRHTDATAGKRTTSVRFGRTFSLIEYRLCSLAAYALVLWDAFQSSSLLGLLPLASLPLAMKEVIAVAQTEGAALNKHVAGAAKVQLVFCILLSIRLVVDV